MADLSYISVYHGDGRFAKVLKLLDNECAQLSTILDAATKLGNELPQSACAKLMYSHVVLRLWRSGMLQSDPLSDQKKELILQTTLSSVVELAADCPKSLVISLRCAKLHTEVGLFDSAEKEYHRAFSIFNPDDPRDHDIPLGYTCGLKYRDRVVQAKVEVLCGLIAFSNMVENHFKNLSEEQKASFLSVRIDKILENNENALEMAGIIDEAVDYYRANLSWFFWQCPLNNGCQNFVASTPSDLLWHVYQQHVNTASNELLYHTVLDKLTICSYVPNDDSHCGLYLTEDNEGNELLCISSLGYLYEGILNMLTRSLTATTSPDFALAKFVNRLSTPDPEVPLLSWTNWREWLTCLREVKWKLSLQILHLPVLLTIYLFFTLRLCLFNIFSLGFDCILSPL